MLPGVINLNIKRVRINPQTSLNNSTFEANGVKSSKSTERKKMSRTKEFEKKSKDKKKYIKYKYNKKRKK